MNYYLLEKELLQKILNYLASKPYSEVNSLIKEICAVKVAKPAEEKELEDKSTGECDDPVETK